MFYKAYDLSYNGGMKPFVWSEEKNKKLQEERGISFERIILAFEHKEILDDIVNPSYKDQNMFVVNIDEYAYVVPYVLDGECTVFKTIFPSRKMTKKYFS